jgi:hypothetical protein
MKEITNNSNLIESAGNSSATSEIVFYAFLLLIAVGSLSIIFNTIYHEKKALKLNDTD